MASLQLMRHQLSRGSEASWFRGKEPNKSEIRLQANFDRVGKEGKEA